MARNILKVEFGLADFESTKKLKFDETKRKICALLNTNGGHLDLIASDATTNNKIHADTIINCIEQWLEKFVGLSETEKNFQWKADYNTITIEITGLPMLCTLNTNLLLPTESSVCILKENKRIREILFERRTESTDELSQLTVPEEFFKSKYSGLRESKSVQFKNLKPEKTGSTDLTSRIIKQKLIKYVSAFANRSGGHIFYGIDDNGIVVGEPFRDEEDVEQVKIRVENAIQKMIWPVKSQEIGKLWDITFVPVKNCENRTLSLTFVVVISVQPCCGGVFCREPESYHVVNGEVKKIPFDTWKEKLKTCRSTDENAETTPFDTQTEKPKTSNCQLERRDQVPRRVKRMTWSSQKSENQYMKITQGLVLYRHLGKWEEIESLSNILYGQKDQHINTKGIALFHLIAIEYRRENYQKATKHLEEFRSRMSTNENEETWTALVEEKYSASAIERSQGNFQAAWEIIEEGFPFCDNVPAGLIPASFYANAASVLSKLVDNESFVGVSRMDKGFTDKVQENVKKVEKYCNIALEHVEYIDARKFQIAREELKQRISIALANLHLKSGNINHMHVPSSDISKAEKEICKAENSLEQLKKDARLQFNDCRMLLAKSLLCLRQYQLNETETDVGNELDTEFFEHVGKAQMIAKHYNFKEIMRDCKSLEDWAKQMRSVKKEKIHEDKSNEMLVNDWLDYND